MVKEGIDSADKDLEFVVVTNDEVRAWEELDVQGGPAEGVYGRVRGRWQLGARSL